MIKYLNVALFCGMLVINYLANALPLNNKTTGEISDSFPNLFVPAGITFSIWGIIYLLLLGYCIVQFRSSYQSVMAETGWLFGVSCLFNALWIVFWHYGKLPLSLVVMISLLVSLILLNMAVSKSPDNIVKIAFGVYLGWICIATIANVTALLVHYEWNGSGISDETWTIIMIVAGGLIAIAALYRLSNPYIALSVIWAYTGIIIKRQNDYKSIAIAAGIAIVIVAVAAAIQFLRKSSPLLI
jgi:tryptophan-rich sensory protein